MALPVFMSDTVTFPIMKFLPCKISGGNGKQFPIGVILKSADASWKDWDFPVLLYDAIAVWVVSWWCDVLDALAGEILGKY